MDEEKYLKMLEEFGVDVENTLQRFVGNRQMFLKFLKSFFLETDLSVLRKQFENEDFEEAYKTAHTWKGVTGNLGLTVLYEKLSALVNQLRKGDYDEWRNELEEMDENFRELKLRILQY